jgi:hypothetical protein
MITDAELWKLRENASNVGDMDLVRVIDAAMYEEDPTAKACCRKVCELFVRDLNESLGDS